MRLFPVKRLQALLLFTMALCLTLVPPVRHDSAAEAADGGILRLHVIANSDSPEDQRVKLLVRDAVLRVMEPGDSAADARAFLLQNGARLLDAAETALRENGFDYPVQLMLGTYAFPERTYGGKTYPEGAYEALRVVLGTGGGQNWWCVLFPPLCLITRESEPLPEADALTFESSIINWFRSWRDRS